MASLKDIRRRIGSVKNTEQITKAMKMVAAAKLRKAQEAAEAARPYAKRLDQVIGELVGHMQDASHPLLELREGKKIDLVVVASDRGLAGPYNGNVLRYADEFLRQGRKNKLEISLIAVGRRVRDYYLKRGTPHIVDEYIDIASGLSYGTADLLTRNCVERFSEHKADRTVLIFTRFKSAMAQTVESYPLLPLSVEALEKDYGVEHKYEPSKEAMLAGLLPRQATVQVFQALMEAVASEHGARMTAMENASRNAGEMIDRLTLQMNRKRQAMITTELMEIIGGKEALEQ